MKNWGRIHLLAVAGLFSKADVQGEEPVVSVASFSCIDRFGGEMKILGSI